MGVNLTAGLDSRLIAYMLARGGVPFRCYTSRDIGSENQAAFAVAEALAAPHTFISSWMHLAQEPDEAIFWALSPTTIPFANHSISLAMHGPWPVTGFIAGHMGDPVSGRQVALRDYRVGQKHREPVINRMLKKHTVMHSAQRLRLLGRAFRDREAVGVETLRILCDSVQAEHSYNLVSRIDFEQRQRRYILRDCLALSQLGPTTIPLVDAELWDYFATVPFEWQLGSSAYVCALQKHLFTGSYEALRRIPVNGRHLRPTRHPVLASYSASVCTRLSKHSRRLCRRANFGQVACRMPQEAERLRAVYGRALERHIEGLEWLCDMDAVIAQMRSEPGTAVLSDYRGLYTVARVSKRVQGGHCAEKTPR